jgi:hypothetical protein
MYAGNTHESIGHHEELIFVLAQADESRYPELVALWEAFYDDPRISAGRAGSLVHELVELLSTNGGMKSGPLVHAVVRLLPFFSCAYRNDQEIRCDSD